MENSRENQVILRNLGVDSTSECQCGAITFNKGKSDFSVLKENVNNFFELDVENFKADYSYYGCNHCQNNWGLDLCACGSGESIEECDLECSNCGQPSQFVDFN